MSEDNLTAAMHGHWVNVMDPETARVMDKGIGSFTWESICNEDTPFCHHSLRRSFVCAGKPRRAFARVAARSLYKLHVNGRFVMFGPARSPSAYCFVDRVDLAAHLHEGRNVVAIETLYVGPRTEYDYGRPGFACALDIDGEAIFSDRAWRWRDWHAYASKSVAGGLRGAYGAEQLDLSKIDSDWTSDAYDDSGWAMVSEGACGTAEGELHPRPFPLPELLEMPPPLVVACAGAIRLGATTEFRASQTETYLVLDFGRTVSGLYEIAGYLPRGATLTCNYLEWLNNADGAAVACGRHGFALVGAGRAFTFQTFHPYSCRYLKLTVAGLKAEFQATVDAVSAREVCSLPAARRAHVLCSDDVLNRAVEAAQNTLRVCTPDLYVDCSSHERRIYLCDSLWEVEAGNIFFGDTAISQAFLDMLPDCVGRVRKFPHLIQNGVLCSGGSLERATLGHNLTWILQGFVHAGFTGTRVSRAFCDAAAAMLKDLRSILTPEGLIPYDDALCQWMDWSKTYQIGGVSTGMNALYYKALSRLAQATGDDAFLKRARALREQMRTLVLPFVTNAGGRRYDRLIPDLFIRGEGGKLVPLATPQAQSFGANSANCCSETIQYWVLWSGLLDKQEERRLWEFLRELRVDEESRKEDNRLYAFSRAGLFGLWVRLSYAFETGDTEVIYRDVREICRPMLDKGDTLWESIGADSRSNAHGFNAYAGTLLYKCISGILPGEAGYDHPVIAPRPGAGLTWGRGFMQVKGGLLCVSWTLAFDAFDLNVSLPDGCRARVRLPPEAAAIAARGGRMLERLDFDLSKACHFRLTVSDGLKIT